MAKEVTSDLRRSADAIEQLLAVADHLRELARDPATDRAMSITLLEQAQSILAAVRTLSESLRSVAAVTLL